MLGKKFLLCYNLLKRGKNMKKFKQIFVFRLKFEYKK